MNEERNEELVSPMVPTTMGRSSLYIVGEFCAVSGVDQPVGRIVEHNRNILVMKVKGHSYWAYRGATSYAKAEFQVFDMTRAERIQDIEDGPVTYRNCYAIGAWDVRQDKKHTHRECSECAETGRSFETQ